MSSTAFLRLKEEKDIILDRNSASVTRSRSSCFAVCAVICELRDEHSRVQYAQRTGRQPRYRRGCLLQRRRLCSLQRCRKRGRSTLSGREERESSEGGGREGGERSQGTPTSESEGTQRCRSFFQRRVVQARTEGFEAGRAKIQNKNKRRSQEEGRRGVTQEGARRRRGRARRQRVCRCSTTASASPA